MGLAAENPPAPDCQQDGQSVREDSDQVFQRLIDKLARHADQIVQGGILGGRQAVDQRLGQKTQGNQQSDSHQQNAENFFFLVPRPFFASRQRHFHPLESSSHQGR